MQIDVNALISQFGYWAVFIGCLAEGETFTLLGGVAAHQGLLHFGAVILAALCGGMLGDSALFFIGRRYGETILQRFKKHAKPVARANRLIRNRPVLFVISVRFIYGLRIVGPIIIGASKLAPHKFLLCNLLGAALWATLFVSLGYLGGEVIVPWLHQFNHHLKQLFWLLPIVAVLWAVAIALKRRSKP